MPAPVVEQPDLAGGHVDILVAAVEAHLGPRDDGDVHADTIEPLIARIGMLWHGRAGADAHEARAAPDHTETGEDLANVRTRLQVRRRLHDATHGVVLAAVHADQADRVIVL